MSEFGEVLTNQSLSRQLIYPVVNFRKGVTAPSDATQGTTPTVPTLRFTAVAELASIGITMPSDWDETKDLDLIFDGALVVGQTNLDTWDWTIDYIFSEDPANNNSLLKTSTQVTGQATVTTANGLAAGDVYRIIVPVSAVDANNPFANATSMAFECHLTNVTGVGDIDVISLCMRYIAKY